MGLVICFLRVRVLAGCAVEPSRARSRHAWFAYAEEPMPSSACWIRVHRAPGFRAVIPPVAAWMAACARWTSSPSRRRRGHRSDAFAQAGGAGFAYAERYLRRQASRRGPHCAGARSASMIRARDHGAGRWHDADEILPRRLAPLAPGAVGPRRSPVPRRRAGAGCGPEISRSPRPARPKRAAGLAAATSSRDDDQRGGTCRQPAGGQQQAPPSPSAISRRDQRAAVEWPAEDAAGGGLEQCAKNGRRWRWRRVVPPPISRALQLLVMHSPCSSTASAMTAAARPGVVFQCALVR